MNEKQGNKIFGFINKSFLLILAGVCLYPILYVIFASFSNANLFFRFNGFLLKPLGFSLAAYKEVLKNKDILIGYSNTIFIVVAGVFLNIVMTALGAYFLSRKNVLWKNLIMGMILVTMYISGGLIPSYMNIKELGMFDTYWALIIPGAISTFNLIILRTSFLGIPDSIEESARVDGASHFTILFNIVMPLSKATLAVLVLYYGVGHWNSWFNAMIYLQDPNKYPLQLILRTMLIQNQLVDSASSGDDQFLLFETMKYAVIVVSTLPVLMLYPFLQKYFEKGVMIGSVKG